MITAPQLLQIITIDFARASTLCDLLNEICPKYGINTPMRLAAFIAQVAHESGNFAHKDENMSYSATRIMQVWPSRFKSLADATPFARNPEKLANQVYGYRMGNKDAGDGFKYRGGGFIQITGKDMYSKYAKYIGKGIDLATTLVRTTDAGAMDSAAWLFAIEKKLLDEADKGEINNISRAINGGNIGLEARYGLYQKALKTMT